jgi:DNA-binding beta-propeller fold protein YncE
MRPTRLASAICAALLPILAVAPAVSQATGPYKILKNVKVGGEGGFDYVTADSVNRRLYIARSGAPPVGRIYVFDLDTLAPVGEIANTSAHGAAIDVASNHGFGSSKPLAMWDAKTLAPIKTIDVQGNPDGLFAEASTGRIYVLSHSAPNVTVINAKDGSIVGTIDLGGAPEQAASDGKGHLYIDLEDKDKIAVVDTKTLAVTTTYDLAGKGGTCAGLAIDAKNNILFATCRKPQTMVILNAATGAILDTLPIGAGTDGAAFNPATMEAFSSQGDGTLTVVKENSPTSFAVEQNLTTLPRAKTLALDPKTNHIVLITAEFGPTPAPAAPTADNPNPRPARAPMIPGSFSILVVGK